VLSYAADKFYDAREKKYVDATEIDLGKLYSSGYAPSNGVLYFSDDITGSSEFPGLRIKNATTLGAGLTVASANPVYTVGDFNTTNKQPAAILTDAYTILSSSWDDSKSAGSMNTRQAANTVINASFITGDTPCSSSNYNGGLASLPRYLEYWGSSKTSTICGSMVNLWNSTQATGKWSLNYYEPPVRDWSFDTDLNDPSKQPPEVPKILIFERSGWSQQYIAWQTE
jgi:hypothetical protein